MRKTYLLHEYVYGNLVNTLETTSRRLAARFYLRSANGNSSVRVYVDGRRLTYPESDRLLYDKFRRHDIKFGKGLDPGILEA